MFEEIRVRCESLINSKSNNHNDEQPIYQSFTFSKKIKKTKSTANPKMSPFFTGKLSFEI